MPDREKYIEVLSKTAKAAKELNEDAPIKISLVCIEDILELLKEQEAKEVIHPYFKACSKGESLYGTCPKCRHRIIEKSNFCGNCGQAVIWTKEGVSRNE